LPAKRKVSLARFIDSRPWLARLHRWRGGPAERIATSVDRASVDADGTSLRVVEVTGMPGDAMPCDSAFYHCGPTCIGSEQQRFMRTKALWPDGSVPNPYSAPAARASP
jgi:hypothetical protein